jgi:hypothetical protein
VADIVEIECEGSGPLQYDGAVRLSDVELYDRCSHNLLWFSPQSFENTKRFGPSFEVTLDDDGNATVVLEGGPECKPGESQIVADEVGYPNETYMTPFTVLPPEEQLEGVALLPSSQVEDDVYSSVATILQVNTPVAETRVALNVEQLFERCRRNAQMEVIGPNGILLFGPGGRREGKGGAPETDDDGGLFVVLVGVGSCQPGRVDVEASLEEAESFNTWNGAFTIEAPRPTT